MIGFLFAFFLLQNLPFTFGDDLNVIFAARQNDWPALVKAVLNPSRTDALFFVAKSGSEGHVFSATLEEHLKAKREFKKARKVINDRIRREQKAAKMLK